MSDTTRPLPAAVSEYMNDRHGATPAEVMDAIDLDSEFREQVEHYCAVTRFTLYKNEEGIDADGLRWDTVEWADIAEWDVSDSEETSK